MMGRARVDRALLAALAVAPILVLPAGPIGATGTSASGPGPSDLVETTDISGLSASPDGRHIAFRTERASLDRHSYSLTWHIAGIEADGGSSPDGGLPIYVDPGLVQTESAFWSSDSRSIYFRALVGGAIGLQRMPLDGSGTRAALVDDADIETVQLASDGAGLDLDLGPTRAAIRRAEEAEYDSGIMVDRSVDLAQNLFRGGSVNGRMATQRLTGQWFRRSGLLLAEPRRRVRLDFATDIARPSTTTNPPEPRSDNAVRATDGSLATSNWFVSRSECKSLS
jgi:hypothetical protein